jgi:Mannosyl-glycoprotein endo-beta-N-acetylglucosaminidase
MRNLILCVAFVATLSIGQSFANPNARINDYVAQYLDIASFESAKSGIPVSIILSQGILESDCGNNKLARVANNHFGVKWKGTQDGTFIYQNDDDKDKHGKAIASKFVKYASVQEGFQQHTEFLKKERYAALFQYERTDYRQWAMGLQSCGYATDPQYANKLIAIIERYQLNTLDIPMVLSLEDDTEEPYAHTEEVVSTSNYATEKESHDLTQSYNETIGQRSEMWEAKKPTATNENGLFEIVTDFTPTQKANNTPQKSGKKNN